HLVQVDVDELPADRIVLVLLEDRRVRRLLILEHDVEDRVHARRAGEYAAQVPLGNDDRVRLPVPVEDAWDQTLTAQALRLAGSEPLALANLQFDAFTGH